MAPAPCPADATMCAMGGFVSVMRSLLSPPNEVRGSFAFQPVCDAVLADAELQQAVVAALLERCLPCLAANASQAAFSTYGSAPYSTLCSFFPAVEAASLRMALQLALRQPGGTAHLRQALSLIPALPLERSVGPGAELFGEQHASVVLLLATLGGPDIAPADGTAAEWQAACWSFMQSLPRVAALILILEEQGRALAVCLGLGMAAAKLLWFFNSITNQAELACWAAAADAAVRLQPMLTRLHALSASNPIFSVASVAHLLLMGVLVDGANAAAGYLDHLCNSHQPFAAGDAQLARLMWQLHSRLCKLVHWLACGDNHAVLPFASAARGMQLLIPALTIVRSGLVDADNHGCAPGVLRCGRLLPVSEPYWLRPGWADWRVLLPVHALPKHSVRSLLRLQRACGGWHVRSALAGAAGCKEP